MRHKAIRSDWNDFIDLMEETFIDLEAFPKRGRPVPDEPWHSEGVRMRPKKSPRLNGPFHPALTEQKPGSSRNIGASGKSEQ